MSNSAFCTEAKRCDNGRGHSIVLAAIRVDGEFTQGSVGKEKLAGGKEPKDGGRIRGIVQLSRSYLN